MRLRRQGKGRISAARQRGAFEIITEIHYRQGKLEAAKSAFIIATSGLTGMESGYFDRARTASGVAANRHRELIGGMWNEVGQLQMDFLRDRGLRPHHKLLDVGCGALRGGVRFVRYLDPGNYYGIDMNQSFLDAGYDIELAAAGLTDRLPRSNLQCDDMFEVARMGVEFDFAIAQSLFTHLAFNRIRQCLQRVARVMKPGAVFYATFFELPEGVPADQPFQHEPGDKKSYDVNDPYHYSIADFEHAIRGMPWLLRYVGAWGHPRGQHMLEFVRV